MLTKILIGLNLVLLGTVALIFVHTNGMKTTVDTLSKRVANLEVQNVQLSRQMVQLEQSPPSTPQPRGASYAGNPKGLARPPRGTGTSDADSAGGEDVASLGELKAEFRREVETMVAQEQTDYREKRREEWQQRMEESVKQSLSEFAEDHQVDESVMTQISTLFDDSTAKRQELREELDARNMSFYEFRQEERQIREEMREKMAELLTADQLEAFEETFPIAPGFGVRGRGRRR
jgi:hypothetical protein